MNFATLAYMTDAEFYNYIDSSFGMSEGEMLRILRNPCGAIKEKQREARLWAASMAERLK